MDHLQSRGSQPLPLLCCGVAPFERDDSVTADPDGFAGAPWATLPPHPLVENRPPLSTADQTPAAVLPPATPSIKAALEATTDGLRLRLLFSLPAVATAPDEPSQPMALPCFGEFSRVGALFDPVGDLTSYLEVTCSGSGEPGGSVGRLTRGLFRRDPRWRCEGMQSAVWRGGCGEAAIELAIPLASLGPIGPHADWRANFYYQPTPGAPHRVWAPTGHQRIDLPERFGILRMEIPENFQK